MLLKLCICTIGTNIQLYYTYLYIHFVHEGDKMAYTKASGQAVNRYSKKAYDDVRVRVKKGQKELIQARATELNKSINSYIVDLIEDDIKQSREGSAGL